MDQQSLLAMYRPTGPLANGNLMCHHQQVITPHLPGLVPVLKHIHRSLIATHIREVAVDVRGDQEEKAWVREHVESKVVPDFLGTNLTYFLHLC